MSTIPTTPSARPTVPVAVESSSVNAGAETETIGTLFLRQAERRPDAVAVKTGEDAWTYCTLSGRARGVAKAIGDAGLGGEEPVAILMEHGPALVAAIVGVLLSGRPYAALDPDQPAEWLAEEVERLGPGAVVHDAGSEGLAGRLAGARRTLNAEGMGSAASGEASGVSADAPACIVFTSGTTGARRGLYHTHRGLLHAWKCYSEDAGLGPQDRIPLITTCAVATSTTMLWGALLNGGTLYPFDLRKRGVEALAALCAGERITVLYAAPTAFRHLARAVGGPGRLPHLRLVRLAGETVLPTDVALFRQIAAPTARLGVALSSTETLILTQGDIEDETARSTERIGVGRVVPGKEVLILDESGRPAGAGEVGRLAVRSRYMAGGYWRDEAATKAAFKADPDDPSVRVLTTGDLARVKTDGQVEHWGRADNVVKVRGHRVDISTVEAALASLSGVREAAAAVEPREDGRLVAYLVLGGGQELDVETARKRMVQVLPAAMVPSVYVQLESMPQTASGKVDRRALPAPEEVHATERPRFREPRKPAEVALAAIWHQVLGVPGIGLDDNFFDLGATSLQTAAMVSRVEAEFGQPLAAAEVVQSPTLEALAQRLPRSAGKPSLMVPLWPHGSKPPFYCIHGADGKIDGMTFLARRMDPDRPFYAFRPPGTMGECLPLRTVRELAAKYIEAMPERPKDEPVLLGGLCLGGIIAWEMAERLRAMQRKIGLIVMIDAHYPLPPTERWGALDRAIDDVRLKIRLFRHRNRLAWARLVGQRLGGITPKTIQERLSVATLAAVHRYKFKPCPDPVAFIFTRDAYREAIHSWHTDRRPMMFSLTEGPTRLEMVEGDSGPLIKGLLDAADTAMGLGAGRTPQPACQRSL